MFNFRNPLIVIFVIGLAGYFIYDNWLAAIVELTPKYVFELAAWTWFSWIGWWSLQRISR